MLSGVDIWLWKSHGPAINGQLNRMIHYFNLSKKSWKCGLIEEKSAGNNVPWIPDLYSLLMTCTVTLATLPTLEWQAYWPESVTRAVFSTWRHDHHLLIRLTNIIMNLPGWTPWGHPSQWSSSHPPARWSGKLAEIGDNCLLSYEKLDLDIKENRNLFNGWSDWPRYP